MTSDIPGQSRCGVCREPVVTPHQPTTRLVCATCLKAHGLMTCRRIVVNDGTPLVVVKRQRKEIKEIKA